MTVTWIIVISSYSCSYQESIDWVRLEGGAETSCKGGILKELDINQYFTLCPLKVVEKKGLQNITQEELVRVIYKCVLKKLINTTRIMLIQKVRAITPKGRQLVPDVVKKELLVKIQAFLSQQHHM